jgi:hypothetical protein
MKKYLHKHTQAIAVTLLGFVSIIIGYITYFSSIDDISVWVLNIITPISWEEIYTPIPLPPPMHDYVYRPMSVLILKWLHALGDESFFVSGSVLGGKAFFSSLVAGVCAWLWMQQYTARHVATCLAIVFILSEPALFSSVNFSEFDTLGAGCILFASYSLHRYYNLFSTEPNILVQHTWLWIFSGVFLTTIFLKESSCFIIVCFLLPQLYRQYTQHGIRSVRAPLLIMVVALLCWFVGAFSLVAGRLSSSAGQLALVDRLPVVLFTYWQIFALCTESAVLAILYRYVRSIENLWLQRGILLIMVIAMCGGIMETINHYQTIYYSRQYYVSILTLILIAVLCWQSVGVTQTSTTISKEKEIESIVSSIILLLLLLFTLVIVQSTNIREDLATRLFLSVYPGILLMVYNVYKQLWNGQTIDKVVVIFLAFSQLWTVSTSSWNYLQQLWFVDSKNTEDYLVLMEYVEANSRVVYTNPHRRFDTGRYKEYLHKNKPTNTVSSPTHFDWMCFFPSKVDSFIGSHANVLLALQETHTDMPNISLDILRQDFSFIRGPRGRGAHMPLHMGDTRCSERSLLEDIYDNEYSNSSTVLDDIAHNIAFKHTISVFSQEKRYYKLPTRVMNIPFFIHFGIPFLQTKVYTHQIYTIDNIE